LITAIHFARELFDLPGLIRNLARQRELIRSMTWRGFTARYRGSFGGLFWSVFQPLVMMVIYTVVFSQFLKVRFATNDSPFSFSVYLLCGLLPWQAFSEGLSASTTVVRSNVNLVKRVVFPLEILPLNLALTAAIQQVIGFILLIPLVWLVTGQLHWSLLFVPVILMLQLLFAVGMNWIIASLAVYLPDLGQLVSLLILGWMFLTPVFYPEKVVPPQMLIILRLNPVARIVTLYRNAFMTGQLPSLQGFIGALVLCLLVFMAGYFWFIRTKKGFADVL
jgi:lipopolysaccharide transport system permease protein